MDITKKNLTWDTIRKSINNNGVIVAFIVIFLLAVIIKGDSFVSTQNFLNILRNNAVIGIISLGMTLIIVSGGIDLSVGSTLVGVGAITIFTINQTGSLIAGLLAGVVVGLLSGLLIGVLVTKGKIPPFIVTLGMMNTYRSVAQHFMKGGGFNCSDKLYQKISNTDLFGVIPLPIIYWLVCAVIVYFIAKHTQLGRHIYAVGSNEKASRLSAINVDRVKIMTYMIGGLMVALASFVETSRLNSINASSSGHFYEMDAISAVVVGGTSMVGGRGSIVGTVFGLLTLGIMNNMMTLIGIPPFLVGAVKGVIIICAVLLQRNEKN